MSDIYLRLEEPFAFTQEQDVNFHIFIYLCTVYADCLVRLISILSQRTCSWTPIGRAIPNYMSTLR
jgi:hypothetical protein